MASLDPRDQLQAASAEHAIGSEFRASKHSLNRLAKPKVNVSRTKLKVKSEAAKRPARSIIAEMARIEAIKHAVIEDALRVRVTARTEALVRTQILMNARYLVAIAIEIGDLLTFCTVRFICKRLRWMSIFGHSLRELTGLHPFPVKC